MTIQRDECFCDNPECRASTSVHTERFAKWETIAARGIAEAIEDAHLCERCSRRRAEGRPLDFSFR